MAVRRTHSLRHAGGFVAFAGLVALIAGLFLASPSPAAAGPSARLDQCANGPASAAPVDCADDAWVNGNLNPAKSQYGEGDTVPYRAVVEGLDPSVEHSIQIEWDVTKQGKYATDVLNPLSAAGGVVDPCGDVAGCAGAGSEVSPFTIFGGSIVGVTDIEEVGSADEMSHRQTISFDPTGSTVVLSWGGHIARSNDYPGGAASAIAGSPYHMRLVALDGQSAGRQDRSLKVAPASGLSVEKSASPSALTTAGPVDFTIVITNADSKKITIDSIVDDIFGDITTECGLPTRKPDRTLDPGESFSCDLITRTIAGPHVDVVTVTDSKGLTASDDAIVAFNQVDPVMSLTKTPSATTVRTGSDVTYTYVLTVTGAAVSDVALVDDKCTPAPTTTDANGVLEPGESWTFSCTHEIDAASVTNVATASGEDAAGAAVTPATAQATVKGITPSLSIAKTSDVDSVTEGGVVTYTFTVKNTGDDELHNVVVADDKCSPVTPASHGTLSPGDTVVFTCVQTIAGVGSQLTNIGTATAVDTLGLTVSSSASKTISVLAPAVAQTAGEVVTEVKEAVFERPSIEVAAAPVPDLARTGQSVGGLVALGLALIALGLSIMATNSVVTAQVRRTRTD